MRRLAFLIPLLAALLMATEDGRTETEQEGTLRVAFTARLMPKELPRHGTAPIDVELGGRISTTDGSDPPGLRRIEIGINRRGHLHPRALPRCRLDRIQPATTAYARQVCSTSRVGTGSFSAAVVIPGQAPYPSEGTVTAFNGVERGHPVILLHIYGTRPVPTSFTLPLRIGRGRGDFGTVLRGTLPSVDVGVGFVTGISLRLEGRRGGKRYLTAGCPAPKGFPGAVFPLVRAGFSFAAGPTLRSTLLRSCRARG